MEEVFDNKELLAIIIRHDFCKDGVSFFTPDDFSQQLAYMKHAKGKTIKPHVHQKVTREIHFTQEVLIIKKGKLRVDFYRQDRSYLNSTLLVAGDVILLAAGGHGFEIVEDLEMIEIKQGPYSKENDKIQFDSPVSSNNLKYNQVKSGSPSQCAPS